MSSVEGSSSEVMVSGERRFTMRVLNRVDGEMVAVTAANPINAYVMDLNYDPIHRDIKYLQDSMLSVALPKCPFAIAILLRIEGFGDVWAFADNDGHGYPPDGSVRELFLNIELASSRLNAVKGYLAKGKSEKCSFTKEIQNELTEATEFLSKARATQTTNQTQAAALAMGSLSKSMWAGERTVFELAQHRIAKAGPRKDFLFGCNSFHYKYANGEYEKLFRELFNYATLPFYWRSFEPDKGKPEWDKIDNMSELLHDAKIKQKGHPLIWLFDPNGIPTWLEDKSYENYYRLSKQRIYDIVSHFKDKIDIWDVINEAHDWANALNCNHQQLLDMTRMACDETRKANPKATRVINNTLMWGDYAVSAGETERAKWTPHAYMHDVIAAGIEFEVLGIQSYYFNNDLLEYDRMFDRFSKFGKPIHVTEIGVASSCSADSMACTDLPPGGLWHEPWSEKIQADYLEQFYTIAYSKPYIKAITNWDFSDEQKHFWPSGGFLQPGNKPKESFHRLKSLIDGWQGK